MGERLLEKWIRRGKAEELCDTLGHRRKVADLYKKEIQTSSLPPTATIVGKNVRRWRVVSLANTRKNAWEPWFAAEPEWEGPDLPSPEIRVLPWLYLGRGRGLMLLSCTFGLLSQFLPWIHWLHPEEAHLNAVELAQMGGFWFWGSLSAWLSLSYQVLLRRTLLAMYRARPIAIVLALVPCIQSSIIYLKPPGVRFQSFQFEWEYGLYLNFILGLCTAVIALRWGGRLDDMPAGLGLEKGHSATRSVGEKLH